MPGQATPSFQRAFVALSYVADRRASELLEAFTTPHDEARLLVKHLAHPERERRAEVLARELSRVALAVAARSLK
jgi:hypothetical protein